MVLQYGNVTRSAFWASGAIPTADNTNQPATLLPLGPVQPATGPQNGIDRPGNDLPGSPFNLPSAGACVTLLPVFLWLSLQLIALCAGGSFLTVAPPLLRISAADPNLCWAACNKTAACKAWAYGIPNCGGDPSQARSKYGQDSLKLFFDGWRNQQPS